MNQGQQLCNGGACVRAAEERMWGMPMAMCMLNAIIIDPMHSTDPVICTSLSLGMFVGAGDESLFAVESEQSSSGVLHMHALGGKDVDGTGSVALRLREGY